jgi:hypothetical protein
LVQPRVIGTGEVPGQTAAQLRDFVVALKVNGFVLHCPPKTFDEDVIQCSAPAVHAHLLSEGRALGWLQATTRSPSHHLNSLLDRRLRDRDGARMHDLAVRNQEGALSPTEKQELFAFVHAGDLLDILKSKARRTLNIKPKKSPPS